MKKERRKRPEKMRRKSRDKRREKKVENGTKWKQNRETKKGEE